LTLEASNGLGGELIMDCPTGTAARVRHHLNLPISIPSCIAFPLL
jgi:hypothetical protein